MDLSHYPDRQEQLSVSNKCRLKWIQNKQWSCHSNCWAPRNKSRPRIRRFNKSTKHKNRLFSDSTSAVLASDSINHLQTTIETEINDIVASLQSSLSIAVNWIPSHVGIKANETADILAKQAATKNHTDVKPAEKRREVNENTDR